MNENRFLPDPPVHEKQFMLNLFSEWHLNSAGKCFSCDKDELLCGEECKIISYYKLWMCNGVCQSWNLPCNGTCLADKKILSLDHELWNHPDSFWKCPYEDKCISPFQLCNQANTDEKGNQANTDEEGSLADTDEEDSLADTDEEGSLADTDEEDSLADADEEASYSVNCENVINKSRLLCDNPDKFNVILNCTKLNSIQCPGNKTQQCIFGEHICNGIIDCIDRYSIL